MHSVIWRVAPSIQLQPQVGCQGDNFTHEACTHKARQTLGQGPIHLAIWCQSSTFQFYFWQPEKAHVLERKTTDRLQSFVICLIFVWGVWVKRQCRCTPSWTWLKRSCSQQVTELDCVDSFTLQLMDSHFFSILAFVQVTFWQRPNEPSVYWPYVFLLPNFLLSYFLYCFAMPSQIEAYWDFINLFVSPYVKRNLLPQYCDFIPESGREGFFREKRCHQTLSSNIAQSSAEVMAVFKDCHQRLPKVLLKWWLSLKTVIKHCLKFCWSDGCLQRLETRLEKRLQIFKDYRKGLEKRLQRKTANQNPLRSLKIYYFSVWAQGSHLWIWQPSRHFVRVGRSKLWSTQNTCHESSYLHIKCYF